MTIRPVDLSGMIQRTDDVGTMKHHQDQKPMVDQQNIQVQVKKEEQKLTHQVQNPEDSKMADTKYDAKEKGNGTYQERKNKKKTKQAQEEGRVVVKDLGGSFDIKI